MKTSIKTLLILGIVAMLAGGVLADDKQGKGKGKRGSRDGARREQIIKKFDKDGDGKLNAEEKAEARKAAAAHRKQRGDEKRKKGSGARRGQGQGRGVGGGGRGGPQNGRPGGFDRAALMKRFDKDGDGKLSESERAEARKMFEKRRAEAIKKFDEDGDGKLNSSERKKLIEEMRRRRGRGRGEGGRPQGGPHGGRRGGGDKKPSGK